MKKTHILSALILACAVFLSSCASTKVTRVDADSTIDLSGFWNDNDLRIVTETLINDCANSTRIKNYKTKSGEAPLVIIGPITNKSSEHIDTINLARRFQTAIINNGTMEFVADSEQRLALRAEKDNQAQYSTAESAKAIAQELGADFMLQGSVRTIVDTVDNKQVRTYYVDMEIIDIESNKILWQGENSDIKKFIKRPKSKF
ncbi:penicillin-binding protein activator LpoB [Treponema sp. C6A8]|uniref:penicillin-binding protein activator LpoB n=1 Tax=Treponema sp. C6A8 TaxID=1410609 RepID=UPI0004883C3A|nr:penicillin-binding protein activator LpoB [Treponema sp. C6A8]